MSGLKAPATLTATTGSSTITLGSTAATQSVAGNGLITVPVGVGQRSARQVVHVMEQHSDVEVVQQQIAHLGQEVQSAVNLLAQRVGTAAELCEVLVGVLAAVAAELGLVPAAVGDCNTAQTVDTASVQARQPVGVSNDKNRQSLDAGVRLGHGHPDGCTNEASVGVAAMMLQCAAAATDAFVQQCNRSGVSTTADGHLFAARKHCLVLPGGVLPGSLITAALPFLKAGSDIIRWPVQQLLLALLPAACKVRCSCVHCVPAHVAHVINLACLSLVAGNCHRSAAVWAGELTSVQRHCGAHCCKKVALLVGGNCL